MTNPATPQAARPGPSVRAVAGWAALVTLLSRLPFAVRSLWDHDSVQFALGALHFDLAAHQPHPPGYPLYVGVLELAGLAGVGPGTAMVALSILAQPVGAFAFTLLVARLVARRPGRDGSLALPTALPAALLAAVLYAANPLLWFYGELPLVYAVEGGLAPLLALAALRMADGHRPFLLACALFALAGGIRPSTLVLLFPLFLYGLWRAHRDGRHLTLPRVAAGAALGAACVLAWLLPLLAAAGGLAAYRRIGGEHFAALLPVTSVLHGAGWPALAHNLEVLVKWAVQGTVPAAAALAVAWAAAVLAGRWRRIGDGLRLLVHRLDWLLAWALPPVLFFALFHVTKAGYTLIHLPALLAAAALAAAPAMAWRRGASERWRLAAPAAAVLAALLAGGGLFLFGADREPGQARWWAAVRHELQRTTLATYERDLDALLAALEPFPPRTTLLLAVELAGRGGAGAEGFLYPYHRHLQWYAPEYPVALLVPEQGLALVTPGGRRAFREVRHEVPVAPEVERLVLVLAGPVGERLELPPARVVLSNPTFHVLALPFRGTLEVGELRLVASSAEQDWRQAPPQGRGDGSLRGTAAAP